MEFRSDAVEKKIKDLQKFKKKRDEEVYLDAGKAQEEREKGNALVKEGKYAEAIKSVHCGSLFMSQMLRRGHSKESKGRRTLLKPGFVLSEVDGASASSQGLRHLPLARPKLQSSLQFLF